MKKTLLLLALFLFIGAGCTSPSSMTQDATTQPTELRDTPQPQVITFRVNKTPLTGGPAYRMIEKDSNEPKLFNGSIVTFTTEDFKKIEEKTARRTDAFYTVTASIQLEKMTDTNTSIPGAPEITYYEAKVLDIQTVQ